MKPDCNVQANNHIVCVSVTGKTTRLLNGYFIREFAVGFFLIPLSLSQYFGLYTHKKKGKKGEDFINKIGGGKTQPRLAIFHKACASCSVLLYILNKAYVLFNLSVL